MQAWLATFLLTTNEPQFSLAFSFKQVPLPTFLNLGVKSTLRPLQVHWQHISNILQSSTAVSFKPGSKHLFVEASPN